MAHSGRILLEIGNTTVKVVRVASDARPDGRMVVERYGDPHEALRSLRDVDAEIICLHVGAAAGEQMLAELEELPRLRTIERPQLASFVGDTYATPDTLGLDRIVGLIGLDGDGIVISCGTAITVDAVADGRPMWGAILPGFRTAAEGLHRRIPTLPSIDITARPSLPACTSVESVTNGILLGTTSAVQGIAGMLARAGFADLAPRILLTGGDGPLLRQLWSGNPQPTFDEALLFRGMLRLLEDEQGVKS